MTKQNTTTKYEVFHAIDDYFITSMMYGRAASATDIAKVFNRKYRLAGIIEVPSELAADVNGGLEYVFDESQNHSKDWNPKAPCRSTSVGDVVKVGDDYYIVAGIGYDPMPNPVSITAKK
jgi:hypothetical protein